MKLNEEGKLKDLGRVERHKRLWSKYIIWAKKKRKNEKQKEGENQWALDIQTNILPDEDKSTEFFFFKKDASNNSTKKEML